MKQTILSKCFGKMKRVALTLFAALCVGSVWAEIKLDLKDLNIDANGTLSFAYQLHYWNTSSTRYPYLFAELLDVNSNVVKTKEIIPAASSTTPLTNEGAWEWKTATLEECGIASKEAFFDGLYTLRVTFKAFKTGQAQADWNVDIKGFDPSGIISCLSDWELKPSKMFVISGNYDTAIGIESAFITYSINDQSMANPQTAAVTLNEDGTFVCNIPFTNVNDKLTYKLTVVRGGVNIAYNGGTNFSTELTEGRITYTWIGNTETSSNNYWKNFENWDFGDGSKYGYPGETSSGYYVSTATFTKNADVDLNGGTFYLLDNSRGFQMSEGITVMIKNGTLGFQPHNDGTRTTLNFGKANSTLILNSVTMPYAPSSADAWYSLKPVAGSTVVVEGDKNYNWRFTPGNNNTKFKVIGGTVLTGYTSVAPGSGSQLEIENGVYIVKMDAGSGFAATTTFRDGPNRQARLQMRNSTTGTTYYNLKLYGTYNIKIPETPYSNPYVLAKLLSANATCTMNIDVSDYKLGAKVPLIQFKGDLDANTKNAMKTMTTTASKLVVKANGVDVKAARNAKLVWNETAKTLYFQQDSQNAAAIGTAEYATLGAAVEAATSGATITVLNDCTADTACVIANKTLTIDLNGKTVKANDTDAASDGNGVFWVQAGGVLTLEDSSEDKSGTVDGNGGNGYKMAIWADGGKVVINAGNYVNENDGTHTQYDLIYAKNGGEIVINGGTFKCATPRWTLNSHNTKTGRFVVTGGKFYQYNPTDFDTDEAVTTWCAAKYRAEADGDWYVIKEGYTVTEESAATVTADTEAEALAQVDFSVTTPEGVDAAAYKNYFKLVATETAEGSKTWTVALALKDEVKPVIAETTPAITFNDDGTVTVNIENELPGLNYGVRYATTVEAVETTAPVAGFTVTPAAGDTAGFFKVVVDFKPIPEAE